MKLFLGEEEKRDMIEEIGGDDLQGGGGNFERE